MGKMVVSALGQEGVTRLSSYISSKVDDKASRAQIIERIEMAISRLEFALERTAMQPITYMSLLRRRKKFKSACIEGTELINKHKLQAQEGYEEAGQVVVRSSSSYLQRIIRAAKLSIACPLGLHEDHLSTSIARRFEWYADCADKFVADVESVCPPRHDPLRYPFFRQLFEGKSYHYFRMEGSQVLHFILFPMISEWRGLEAKLYYKFFDPERLDKSLYLSLTLRLSESTDIVGIARSCLQSSASLLNLVAVEDAAMGELALLLSNLEDISYSYAYVPIGFCALIARICRPNPVCCHAHANVHKPGAKDIISSELSHIFPERVIMFRFTCYIPAAAEYSFPRASDKAGRIRNAMMIDRAPPLEVSLYFTPHSSPRFRQGECFIFKKMGNNEDRSPYGSIQQTIATARSEAMECLLHQPEVTECRVSWNTNHGRATLDFKWPSADIIEAVASTRGGYNTRSAAKRKRCL